MMVSMQRLGVQERSFKDIIKVKKMASDTVEISFLHNRSGSSSLESSFFVTCHPFFFVSS